MQSLQQWFRSVDRDNSGTVQTQELAGIQFDGKPLGTQVATKLVKVFDKDQSGAIDFNEYVALQRFLELMQRAFLAAVGEGSTISPKDILTATGQAGFELSITTIEAAVRKFDPTCRGLDFPSFLYICAHFAHCRSIFEWNDQQRVGKIQLTYDALCHIGIELLGNRNSSF